MPRGILLLNRPVGCGENWWVDQTLTPPPKLTLPDVIAALRVSLFGWCGRGILTWALMSLVHRRLGVVSAAMERLMARFVAGKAMRHATRAVVAVEPAEVTERVWVQPFWPRTFGWLTTLMKHHAALYTVRMEMVLAEPEMVALLTASPQAVRLLRPMCRMLGVTPALLRPGVPTVAKPVVEPRKRVRTKRPPIDWGRIPLPRGVLSAARRAGFKPVR